MNSTSMTWEEREKLLPLLRFWCFGGQAPVLTAECLELLQRDDSLLPALWHFHHQELSGSIAETAHESFRAATMLDMRQEAALREITRTLNEAGIPFLPVKGADLAYRVYPDSAIRQKVDIDLFLSPADCPQAVKSLKAAGWNTPYQYSNRHHEPDMERNGIFAELHFTLPGFRKEDGEDLWREMAGSSFPPLEWNLLLLLNHALIPMECNGFKLLLDTGFLLRHSGCVDWEKVDRQARRFHAATPTLMVAAFPDFFPAEYAPGTPLPDKEKSQIRKLFLNPFPSAPRAVSVMSEPSRFTLKWWKDRMTGLTVASVRVQTSNPQGHYGKLIRSYLTMLWRKAVCFWRYRGGDKKQAAYLKNFHAVKSLLQTGRDSAGNR